ncbi:MAG: hypothetical protein FWD16_04530, partial [Clostridia bacterium]|nr:hypothetical protein [Clostridia bacterium]
GYDTMKLLPGSVVGGTNPANVLANVFLRWPDEIQPPTPPEGLVRRALDAGALAGLKWRIYDETDFEDIVDEDVVWEWFREEELSHVGHMMDMLD